MCNFDEGIHKPTHKIEFSGISSLNYRNQAIINFNSDSDDVLVTPPEENLG